MRRPARTTTSSTDVGLRLGFRSGLEQKAAAQIEAEGLRVAYEEFVVKYTVPERQARYTADFRLPNGIIVETKGRFVTADRKKHKLIRLQHPTLDIRIVFQNPNARISKKSATTYAKWCDDHGVKWAKAHSKEAPIPPEWFKE
jgi:hypothetical protein